MAEELLRIRGGSTLHGEVPVQGAKNSALPLMAAALMCSGETVLHRVPRLTDIRTAGRILEGLGCACRTEENTAVIRQHGLSGSEIPDAEMRRMRSSIMFLGPLLGSAQECILTMPGGCELGPRPIDLHLDAMRRLGAEISEQGGRICCRAKRLRGARITLPLPSVGATENVLTAAAVAEGETVLCNAAREPEICDLARFLNQCGARISGAGGGTVTVAGVGTLHGTEYTVMPDRIAAMTWLCAGAAAGGCVCVSGAVPQEMETALSVLEAAGCRLRIRDSRIELRRTGLLRGVRYIRTMPYPGFPTDDQAPVCAMLSAARGTTVMEETLFESRYKYVGELLRMGADIRISGRTAVITGVPALHGADVSAMDLRGGAALGIAAAAASGETLLRGLGHIDRGYEDFAGVFNSLGCETVRLPVLSASTEKTGCTD